MTTKNATPFEREIAIPLEQLGKPRPCMGCGKPFSGFNIHCADCADEFLRHKRELDADMDRSREAFYPEDLPTMSEIYARENPQR